MAPGLEGQRAIALGPISSKMKLKKPSKYIQVVICGRAALSLRVRAQILHPHRLLEEIKLHALL